MWINDVKTGARLTVYIAFSQKHLVSRFNRSFANVHLELDRSDGRQARPWRYATIADLIAHLPIELNVHRLFGLRGKEYIEHGGPHL